MESNLFAAEQLLNQNSERIKAFFKEIDNLYNSIEKILSNGRPILDGERYITDKEVAERLCISRRTLHDWRNNNIIGYVKLGGKILYRESDLLKLLNDNYYSSHNIDR